MYAYKHIESIQYKIYAKILLVEGLSGMSLEETETKRKNVHD